MCESLKGCTQLSSDDGMPTPSESSNEDAPLLTPESVPPEWELDAEMVKEAVENLSTEKELCALPASVPVHRRRRERRCSRKRGIRVALMVLGHAVLTWLIIVGVMRGARRVRKMCGHGEASQVDELFPSTADCPFATFHETTSAGLTFENLEEFSIHEFVDDFATAGSIGGSVKFVEAPQSQESSIFVNVTVATSSYYPSRYDIKTSQTPTGLEIRSGASRTGHSFTQRVFSAGRSPNQKQCTDITATVYMHPDTALQTLNLTTRHLSLSLPPNFSLLQITHQATLSTDLGSITGSLSAPHTTLTARTGSIFGTFALDDALSLTTSTGSIDVAIEPQPATDTNTLRPAVFSARSGSGSVNAVFRTANLPPREYSVDANSVTGSVRGLYVHGARTAVSSGSGAIDVSVLPYTSGAADAETTLTTETRTGSTRVTVLAPGGAGTGTEMLGLRSEHRGASGSMGVVYPGAWAGRLKAGAMTGSVTVRGRDVVVWRDVKGVVGREVEAYKGEGRGEGKSWLDVSTVTGKVDVLIGEE